jgi:LacI family transcriptional regulator
MPRVNNAGKKATLRDVAALAGVAVGTASQALNGSTRFTPATLAKVQQAARTLGYRPHPAARRLARATTEAIGIITPSTLSPVHAHLIHGVVIRGILDVVTPAGYNLIIAPMPRDGADGGTLPRIVAERDVDGLVTIGLFESHSFAEIDGLGLPAIHIDTNGAPGAFVAVDNDDRLGAYLATAHLLGLGHRRIGLITGTTSPFGQQVIRGYQQALDESGIRLDRHLIQDSDLSIDGGYTAMQALLALSSVPSAVFAGSDYPAIGAMHAALAAGCRVPDDIAVVGMDDIEMSAHIHPPLTTVRVHYEEMGKVAARLLLDYMTHLPEQPRREVIAPELIVRASCGASAR